MLMSANLTLTYANLYHEKATYYAAFSRLRTKNSPINTIYRSSNPVTPATKKSRRIERFRLFFAAQNPFCSTFGYSTTVFCKFRIYLRRFYILRSARSFYRSHHGERGLKYGASFVDESEIVAPPYGERLSPRFSCLIIILIRKI